MSVVFSAFTLSYSLFEIPSGWLGDVKGPRRVLTRIVLWWSAFTMLTGAARGFQSLLGIRFLFGAGEAGAFPNIARSFSRWFPHARAGPRQRRDVPRIAAWVACCRRRSRCSSIRALGLARELRRLRLLGLVWAAAWYTWYRDRPEDHPRRGRRGARVDSTGRRRLRRGRRRWTARGDAGRSLAAATSTRFARCHFAFGYGLYFYFTWLPTYLMTVLGFSRSAAGLFAALPFLLAGIADLAAAG